MQKILCRDELKKTLDGLKERGSRIVFTNGCFDLIHRGHVTYLREAKALGDVLVIAVNSDASVASLKGPGRPIVPEEERVAVVAALESADFVTLFHEDTPQRLIEYLEPHILVKGGDWREKDVAGRDVVERVVIIPSVPGVSTTDIIARIRERLRHES
ncbi:MAG: adenylyltransferase/cytidyltransferase family protein [Syntrophales bacterium]|jgi:D-beta-D-heptose 7-phosphate kinase/D-beta-D-heptose 1-phosphate adenosyltransferase|nr:adenylyltransferase/cytidyltransferase family protein [Syntrophales bacterium]MCK9527813.1 adenylyltransferase/cytidyltransferase family protein [Syntrophales bacterium]MDX9922090.1 adenylyltransferase/cytidyltransferase family protein [Syntrophales bacterium]